MLQDRAARSVPREVIAMIYTPYIWPLLISATLLTGLTIYARRFSDAPARRPFQWMMALGAVIVLLQAAEISAASQELKTWLLNVRFIPFTLFPIVGLLLSLEYTGNRARFPWPLLWLMLLEALVMCVLSLTTLNHMLFRYNFHLIFDGPFPVLAWSRGTAYWLHITYSSLIYIIVYGLLIKAFWNRTLYRRTTVLIVIGIMIPWFVDTLFNMGITPIRGYNLSPSSYVVTGLFFIWAFWRYRLFNVVPVARNTAMENLNDLLFVFDQRDHLVDFNRAAQTICGLSTTRSLGLTPHALPPVWAELYTRYAQRGPCREEVTLQLNGQTVVYDLTLSLITDTFQRKIGRVFLLHDITARRVIEETLHQRERILRAINAVAAVLLTNDTGADNLTSALELLGQATAASRVYVYENALTADNQLIARQRAEWVAPGVESQGANRMLENPAVAALFQQWIAVLREHHIFQALVRDLPADTQTLLAVQDIRALLVVPIFVQDQWWGFIGFDDCRTERVWSAIEIDALTTAAEVLGASLQRTRTDALLRDQQRELASLEERERIGRELHDGLGQVMGYVNVQAQAARLFVESGQTDQTAAALMQLIQVAQDAHADIRGYIVGVRTPDKSSAPDWLSRLENYLLTFEQQYGIAVALHLPADLPRDRLRSPFTPDVEAQALGIVREALNNIRKYAGVKTARLELALDGPYVRLLIIDDGSGFTPASDLAREAGGRFGLTIMRERAAAAGGTLEIESAPGQGTRLTARLPLRPALSEAPAVPRGLRVALVDDHPLFLDGLRNMLLAHGVQVVGTGRDGQEAIDLVQRLRPDILLLDIHMPRIDGLEATRRIRAEDARVKIVILTVAAEDEVLFEALKAGASGYLLKSLDSLQFYDLLTDVMRGELALSPGLAVRVLDEFARPTSARSDSRPSSADSLAVLTDRQREILELAARGLTYKEIGATLSLSQSTVKYHMGQIIEQLHVNSRREAVTLALNAKRGAGS
jgi:PAS domain S-box-containing protein